MRDRKSDTAHRANAKPGLVVHHLDEDKANNAPANLQNEEPGAHTAAHNKTRPLSRLRKALRMPQERRKLYGVALALVGLSTASCALPDAPTADSGWCRHSNSGTVTLRNRSAYDLALTVDDIPAFTVGAGSVWPDPLGLVAGEPRHFQFWRGRTSTMPGTIYLDTYVTVMQCQDAALEIR